MILINSLHILLLKLATEIVLNNFSKTLKLLKYYLNQYILYNFLILSLYHKARLSELDYYYLYYFYYCLY